MATSAPSTTTVALTTRDPHLRFLRLRSILAIGSAANALVLFAVLLAGLVWMSGCLAQAPDEEADAEPASRVIAMWDPLHCTDDHRVVVELEDDAGVRVSRSAPCSIGSITLDVQHWGFYLGQCYAWAAGKATVRATDLSLAVDGPIIHWQIVTPP